MPRGGARQGAGRKPGAITRKTRAAADRLVAEGATPLDYLLGVMRGTIEYDEPRFEAAKAAAPYCHAKLMAAKVEGKVELSLLELITESQKYKTDLSEGEAGPLH